MPEQVASLSCKFLCLPGGVLCMLPLRLLCMFPWGVFGVIAKLGPLERSENCAGLSGLDDKLMTHLLLETEEATGLLVVDLELVALVADIVDIEMLVVEPLVVVVVVVAGPVVLLFSGRTTFVVSLNKEFDGGDNPYLVADYDGIHFF